MSNKLRIRQQPQDPEQPTTDVTLVVEKCNPHAPWTPLKQFTAVDRTTAVQAVIAEFPKARFR